MMLPGTQVPGYVHVYLLFLVVCALWIVTSEPRDCQKLRLEGSDEYIRSIMSPRDRPTLYIELRPG